MRKLYGDEWGHGVEGGDSCPLLTPVCDRLPLKCQLLSVIVRCVHASPLDVGRWPPPFGAAMVDVGVKHWHGHDRAATACTCEGCLFGVVTFVSQSLFQVIDSICEVTLTKFRQKSNTPLVTNSALVTHRRSVHCPCPFCFFLFPFPCPGGLLGTTVCCSCHSLSVGSVAEGREPRGKGRSDTPPTWHSLREYLNSSFDARQPCWMMVSADGRPTPQLFVKSYLYANWRVVYPSPHSSPHETDLV